MANQQTDTRSSEQIRRDLEGARSELHDTVDALEYRLSPGQIVDEVWGRMRGGSSDHGTVRAFGDVVRRHPAPAALIGLGLAWIAAERRGGGETAERMRENAERIGSAGMQKVKSGVKSGASSAVDAAKEKAHQVADEVRDRASGAAENVKERLSETRTRASHAKEHAGERLRGDGTNGWSARSSFERQPLAAGALSFGLGLAAGLMAPATEREDRLMGSTADAVKDEARHATKDVAASARTVAEDVAEAAKEEVREQGIPGQLKHAAQEVGRAAKEEARERAQQEEIDPEGIRRRASHVGEDIRDRTGQNDR